MGELIVAETVEQGRLGRCPGPVFETENGNRVPVVQALSLCTKPSPARRSRIPTARDGPAKRRTDAMMIGVFGFHLAVIDLHQADHRGFGRR